MESSTIMLIGAGFLGWEEFGVFGQPFSDGSILKVGLRIECCHKDKRLRSCFKGDGASEGF